jgi:pimeloyl-ACP methyl ester carboxylesterase
MATTAANGIDLAYEVFGDQSGEPVLMIHGLGAQYTDFDQDFLSEMVKAGYFVIVFDNRDQGESTWFDAAGIPDMGAILMGDVSQAPYLLSDMAADAKGLLNALGIEKAHIFGVSMGGMIAQQFAIDFPDATKTLTSIMSTPDPTSVGQPTAAALEALLQPPASGKENVIEQSIATARVIGSPGFPFDEVGVRRRAAVHFDRGNHPEGTTRQTAAIFCSPDRRPGLRELSLPALVVHGSDDPLVTLPGGEATAEALRGSTLWVIPGMGHDLPVALWPELISRHQAMVASAQS